jgi:hypothetical protein
MGGPLSRDAPKQNEITTEHRAAELTLEGKVTFARTEMTDISVLPQRLLRRPHLFQIVAGDLPPRTITLGDQPVAIGRGSDCGMRLISSDLSRRHARLERTRRGYLLSDLDSRNGVYVNEVRVDSVVLRDGDTVQLGNLQLIYHEGS